MAGELGELVFNILFKGNVTSLRDIIKGISSLNVSTALAAFGLDVVYDKLKEMTTQTVSYGKSLKEMSLMTGLSAQEMEDWGRIAEKANGDAESLQNRVARLRAELADIHRGIMPDWWHETNRLMGIHGKAMTDVWNIKDPKDLILRMREAYQLMNSIEQQQFRTTQQSDATFTRILGSQKEVWDLSKEIHHMTNEQIDATERWGKQSKEFHRIARQYGADVVSFYLNPLAAAGEALRGSSFLEPVCRYGQSSMVHLPLSLYSKQSFSPFVLPLPLPPPLAGTA